MKKYYFKEKFFKITDKYWILDENNEKTFYLDQSFNFWGYSVDVFSKKKSLLFHIEQKIISFLPKFFVEFTNGDKIEIKQNLSFFKKSISVDTNFGEINLRGSIWDHDFKIYLDNKLIGEVKKKFFSFTDHYELKVYDESQTLISIGLVICLNKIQDDEAAMANSYIKN